MTFDPTSVEVTCVTLSKDHCVQVPWEYINVCGYSDQFCKLPHTYTYYIHTTHRMSNHIVQRLSRAGPRGRGREWATLAVHPLSWLLSNIRLEEVCGTLTKGTFSSRLLLSNQDKGCTPSVAHSLPLPLPPGFCSTCLVSFWTTFRRDKNDDSNLQTKLWVHITSNIFKIIKFLKSRDRTKPPRPSNFESLPYPRVRW